MFDKLELLSDRAKGMRASEIRELLRLTQQPEIISFAGGLPNPKAFPTEEIKEICVDVLNNNYVLALQYGSTEGSDCLREALANRLNGRGFDITKDNIIITNGSQQVLDLLSKVLLNPGDDIIVGAPTYIGALGSFRAFQAKMTSIQLDNYGMKIDLLEEELENMRKIGKRPKFIYLVPTFHNPAGVTLSENRRKKLIDLSIEYETLLIEDDPYGELRFSGENIPALKSFDKEGTVIYTSTFSKILCPGLRLAFLVASDDLHRRLSLAKQSTDLCSNTFVQYIGAEYINRGYINTHIEKIKKMYSKKKNLMLDAMEKHFPEGAKWTKPEGGMFSWATLPKEVDTKLMFDKAIEQKVAYIHGAAFHADGGGRNTMRLNFSFSDDEIIEEGIKRLANVIKNELKN